MGIPNQVTRIKENGNSGSSHSKSIMIDFQQNSTFLPLLLPATLKKKNNSYFFYNHIIIKPLRKKHTSRSNCITTSVMSVCTKNNPKWENPGLSRSEFSTLWLGDQNI